MDILYIIGNGFDLAQGLETSFKHFYKVYKAPHSEDTKAISNLKSAITDDIETWADFEKAFGQYTERIPSAQEYHEVIDDFKEKLDDYLSKQEENFVKENDKTIRFINNLTNPSQFLYDSDKIKMLTGNLSINIISLNYTNTIEKLIGAKYPLGITPHSSIRQIVHLHGNLKDTILVGVNDETQVANKDLLKDSDVYNELIKPKANDAMHNMMNETMSRLIEEADTIILFGTALGDTDNKWWLQIGARLADPNFRLIYFVHSNYIHNVRKKFLLDTEYVRNLNFLAQQLAVSNKIESYKSRIMISINSDMFKL